MLLVVLMSAKGGTRKERTARRLEWKYPEGARLLGEYWLQADDPNVISIVETESLAPVTASLSAWDDLFSFTVIPAVTAEEGLQFAKQMMQK